MHKNIILVLFVGMALSCVRMACAESLTDKEIDALANAIYVAEGKEKAVVPYGIFFKGCSWNDVAYCRKICKNTIRNNIKRYNDYGYKKYNTYLEFLASKYCPLDDPRDTKGLNKHWLGNVKYYYRRFK